MTKPIVLQTAGGGKLVKPGEVKHERAAPKRVTMQKATLNLYAAEPAPGGSKPGASLGFLEFQFNPKEVTITKAAKWERKPAKGAGTAGPPDFKGADGSKLTLEMFFDATSTQDGAVVKAVEQLFACCIPTEQSRSQKKPTPPLVVLHWGSITSFAS